MGHGNWVGSRQLLRRMRNLMAGPGSAQVRLDKIAKLIARDMVAEVCSIYARRADDILELFATQGLRQDALGADWSRVSGAIDASNIDRSRTIDDPQSGGLPTGGLHRHIGDIGGSLDSPASARIRVRSQHFLMKYCGTAHQFATYRVRGVASIKALFSPSVGS